MVLGMMALAVMAGVGSGLFGECFSELERDVDVGDVLSPSVATLGGDKRVLGGGKRGEKGLVMTMSLLKNGCSSIREEDIHFGDLVWGRVTGYPWWPARICLNERAEVWKKSGRYWVSFFNDDHGAWLAAKVILPWSDEVKSVCLSATKKYRERVELAVLQAEEHRQLVKSYTKPLPLPEAGVVSGQVGGRGGLELLPLVEATEAAEPEPANRKPKRKKATVAADYGGKHGRTSTMKPRENSSAVRLNGYFRYSASMRAEQELLGFVPESTYTGLGVNSEELNGLLADGDAPPSTSSGDEQSSTVGIDVRGLGTLPDSLNLPSEQNPNLEDITIDADEQVHEQIQPKEGEEGMPALPSGPATVPASAPAAPSAPPVPIDTTAASLPRRLRRRQRHGGNAAYASEMAMDEAPTLESKDEEDTETESESRRKPGMRGSTVSLNRVDLERLLRHVSLLETKLGIMEKEMKSMRPAGGGARHASSIPSTSSPASASFSTILQMFGDPESAALRASLEALQKSAECFLEAKRANGTLDSVRAELERVIPTTSSSFLFQSIAASLLYHYPDQTTPPPVARGKSPGGRQVKSSGAEGNRRRGPAGRETQKQRRQTKLVPATAAPSRKRKKPTPPSPPPALPAAALTKTLAAGKKQLAGRIAETAPVTPSRRTKARAPKATTTARRIASGAISKRPNLLTTATTTTTTVSAAARNPSAPVRPRLSRTTRKQP